jgi:hypothetical protein
MATATTLTQTLVKAWSSDMTIMKRERIDMERLAFLSSHPDVPKDTKRELKKLSEKITEGCWAKIGYSLGKQAKESSEALGRLNAEGNVGLQGLKRDVRNFLANTNYWDIDMVAAHPTLCLSMCRRQKLTCEYQTELIEKREEKFAELMEAMSCSRAMAKEYITILYFGEENASFSLPVWFKSLHQEISNARKVITQNEEWTEALKFLNGKKKNRLGSAFSFILQSVERECLLAMERSAKKHGRSLDTYIHDGGLIRKREGEEAFPDELLREFEKDIEADTGYAVCLASKVMETSWVMSEKDDQAYREMRDWFENKECVFSLKYPAMYCRVFDGQLQMFDRSDLIKNYEGYTYGDEDEGFLNRWFKDRHKKQYEELVFLPMKDTPENKFNIFRGFSVKPKQNDALIERWLYLIYLVANKDEAVKNWILDYLAHLFQKPYEKPGVAIVVKGKKGSGKDTPFDKIGELLGDMFYNTGTPEKSVFSSFNGMMMRNLLVKFEEATYGNGKTYEETLKYFITTPTLDIQKKGKDQFNVRNYSRFIFTTNNDIPVIVSDDERRYCLIQTSDEKRGDRAFWNETYAIMKQEGFNEALMHFLLNRDISKFEARNYPKTDYGDGVKQSFIPNHAQWFRQWIERNDEVVEFKEQANKILDRINEMGKFQINHRQLFVAVNEDYKDIITRTTPNNKVHYHFRVEEMRKHLQQKGWWAEL